MKIIDILTQTADLIGLTRESKILNQTTCETENETLENEEISGLYSLMKYSIQELCTNYVPIIANTQIEISNNSYPLSNLENYIYINALTKNNQYAKYKIINRNIVVEENGTYTVEYATYPTLNSLFDEVDFLSSFNPDVIIFGLAAYYTLSRGRFDEFKIFHEQYLEKAESLKALKSFNTPQRRWEWIKKELV